MQEIPQSSAPSKKRVHIWIILAVLVVLAVSIYLINSGVIKFHDDADEDEAKMPAIKVIITNGCGYENLATDYSNYIGTKNVDVVKLTDTKPIYDKSIIVMLKDDEQDLQRLQKISGIQLFTKAINENADAQFIIILGRDYSEYMKPDKGGRFGR